MSIWQRLFGKRSATTKNGGVGGYFPATDRDVRPGEVFRQKETDVGDFIIRRLAPGMYEIVSKRHVPQAG
jgi:hypothetical protein